MSSSVQFATPAWVDNLAKEINGSQSYRTAAKNWEGDFYFIVEPDNALQEPVYMYMDLFHGECRQAFIAENAVSLDPEFSISGSRQVWQSIAQKKLDPMKALLTRQLSVKGNMAKIMRNVRAANELVNCVTMVETEFFAD